MGFTQVIVADNYFTGSKDNLKQWIGHPRFELIRHGRNFAVSQLFYAFVYIQCNEYVPLTFQRKIGTFRVSNSLLHFKWPL